MKVINLFECEQIINLILITCV